MLYFIQDLKMDYQPKSFYHNLICYLLENLSGAYAKQAVVTI